MVDGVPLVMESITIEIEVIAGMVSEAAEPDPDPELEPEVEELLVFIEELESLTFNVGETYLIALPIDPSLITSIEVDFGSAKSFASFSEINFEFTIDCSSHPNEFIVY